MSSPLGEARCPGLADDSGVAGSFKERGPNRRRQASGHGRSGFEVYYFSKGVKRSTQ